MLLRSEIIRKSFFLVVRDSDHNFRLSSQTWSRKPKKANIRLHPVDFATLGRMAFQFDSCIIFVDDAGRLSTQQTKGWGLHRAFQHLFRKSIPAFGPTRRWPASARLVYEVELGIRLLAIRNTIENKIVRFWGRNN